MSIEQILIGKSAAMLAKRGGGSIASAKEVNDLADGAFAIINEAGALVTAVTGLDDSKHFWIAVGGATAKDTIMSKKIQRHNASYSYKAYAAPVNGLVYLGDNNTNNYDVNLPATLVAGTVATITLVDTADGNLPHKTIHRYDYRVKTGDAKEDVLNALIALINADDDAPAVATGIDVSSSNAGIKFDNNAGVHLKVLASGILIDAPLTGAVAPDPGVGTATKVAELESYASVYFGNTSRLELNALMYTEPSRVVAGATYDLFVLNYEYTKDYVINSQNATKQTLILAIPNGSASIATLTTYFDAAFKPQTTQTVLNADFEDRIDTLENP